MGTQAMLVTQPPDLYHPLPQLYAKCIIPAHVNDGAGLLQGVQPLFCVIHWRGSTFDITATTAECTWKLEDHVAPPPGEHPLMEQQYMQALKDALCTDQPRAHYTFNVATRGPELQVEVQFEWATAGREIGIRLKLGRLQDQARTAEVTRLMQLMWSGYGESMAAVNRLTTVNHQLVKQVKDVKAQLSKEISTRKAQVEELSIEYSLLLNEKTRRLREAQAELDSRADELIQLRQQLRQAQQSREAPESDEGPESRGQSPRRAGADDDELDWQQEDQVDGGSGRRSGAAATLDTGPGTLDAHRQDGVWRQAMEVDDREESGLGGTQAEGVRGRRSGQLLSLTRASALASQAQVGSQSMQHRHQQSAQGLQLQEEEQEGQETGREGVVQGSAIATATDGGGCGYVGKTESEIVRLRPGTGMNTQLGAGVISRGAALQSRGGAGGGGVVDLMAETELVGAGQVRRGDDTSAAGDGQLGVGTGVDGQTQPLDPAVLSRYGRVQTQGVGGAVSAGGHVLPQSQAPSQQGGGTAAAAVTVTGSLAGLVDQAVWSSSAAGGGVVKEEAAEEAMQVDVGLNLGHGLGSVLTQTRGGIAGGVAGSVAAAAAGDEEGVEDEDLDMGL